MRFDANSICVSDERDDKVAASLDAQGEFDLNHDMYA